MKKQDQRKKQRRQSEERRTSSNTGPRRGCLANVGISDTLPEDGLYIEQICVPGGVNEATFQSPQKAVENFGQMLNSPSGRWLWWRLHEVRTKVLSCHCREDQPCHGDEIIRAFAEATSEEEPRGGALSRLEGLSICEVGWVLRSQLCLSPRGRGLAMQEMSKSCSTLSRGEEVRNILPLTVSPDPTQAERDLSMTSAHPCQPRADP